LVTDDFVFSRINVSCSGAPVGRDLPRLEWQSTGISVGA
jgi:hypothetical protein